MDTEEITIVDTQPQRVHDITDAIDAVVSLVGLILLTLITMYLQGITSGVESDVKNLGHVFNSWLIIVPLTFIQQLMTVCIVIAVLVQLLVNREWIQSIIASASLLAGYIASGLVTFVVLSVKIPLLTAALDSPTNLGGVLLPDAFAALAAFLTAAGPHRLRSTVKWSWNSLFTVGVIVVLASSQSLTGVGVAMLLGRMVGLIIRYFIGTPNVGAWGMQLVEALHTIGIYPSRLISRSENADGSVLSTTNSARITEDSAHLDDDLAINSRIYDVTTAEGTRYVVSVTDEQTHSIGYIRQLWHWIQLNDISLRRDRSVRDNSHHHLDMLLALRYLGLTTAKPYAVTETRESSLLVFEADEALHSCDWDSVTDDDLVDVMQYLNTANSRGYTHRFITPSSIARDWTNHLVIAGWDKADAGSNGASISIDRVQLIAALTRFIDAERVLNAACTVWGAEQTAQLAPFVQRVIIPAETRASKNWDRHSVSQLSQAMLALVPDQETINDENMTLSRFSLRNFIGAVLIIVAVIVVFTQLDVHAVVKAITHAKPMWAVLCFCIGSLTWLGNGISLGSFMDKDKRHYGGIFASQVAQGLTSVTMPAGIGPAFVNLQFLRKSGYRNDTATAIMSVIVALQFVSTLGLIILIGIFTGRNTLSGTVPTSTIAIVLGMLALVISLAMVIPYTRKLIMNRLIPLIQSYTRQLVAQLSHPNRVIWCCAGSVIQSLAIGTGYWAALKAFGQNANILETLFVFLIANTLGSVVPTPGGLGGVEAAVTLGFTGIGIPSAVALSATMLYRVLTYWVRIPLGAIAMQWLNKHDLI